MFTFDAEVVYTGEEVKVSKKGNEYKIVHLLDPSGKQFSCMLDGSATTPYGLTQLDKVSIVFSLEVGRYTSLKILAIDKA